MRMSNLRRARSIGRSMYFCTTQSPTGPTPSSSTLKYPCPRRGDWESTSRAQHHERWERGFREYFGEKKTLRKDEPRTVRTWREDKSRRDTSQVADSPESGQRAASKGRETDRYPAGFQTAGEEKDA